MLAEALAPIFIYTVFGMLLRAGGMVKADLAPILFRFVFVATLPLLIFTSIARAPLDASAWQLPLAGFATNAGCALGALVYARWKKMGEREKWSLVILSSVINMMLMYPFMLYGLGEEAMRDAILFDIGNSAFVSTVASAIALNHGRDGHTAAGRLILETVRAPIFIGVLAALVVNLGGFEPPSLVFEITGPLGAATIPLILVALGVALSPSALKRPLPLAPILLRMGLGIMLGIALAAVFDLGGMTRWVVIASAAAPIGFGSVALNAIGRFDVERATAAVTLSVAIGLLSITSLLWLARQVLADAGS